MIKKIISVLVFLGFSLSLFAATWTWSSDYINVTNYRYQLDSESEDGWTVVPSSVTRFETETFSNSVLYVQQSLDNGNSWSPSGKALYEVEVIEDTPVAVVEEVPVETENKMPLVIEEVQSPIKQKKDFSVGFGLYPFYERILKTEMPLSSLNSIGAELEFSLNNLLVLGSASLGANLDIGAVLTPWEEMSFSWFGKMFDSENTLFRYYADLLFSLNFSINKLDINLELGGGASLVKAKDVGVVNVGSSLLVPAFVASVGLNYNFTKNFFMGFDVKYHFDTKPQNHRISGLAKIGVNF